MPTRTELDFLRARRLEMICFAGYALYLHFGDGIVVTIEGEFEHQIGGERPQRCSFPLENSKLMRLLDKNVEALHVLGDASLRLNFSNGDRLTIRGKNGPYESYHIKHAGAEITV
jgi:hypothetical protein